PLRSILFPYTTLFRSIRLASHAALRRQPKSADHHRWRRSLGDGSGRKPVSGCDVRTVVRQPGLFGKGPGGGGLRPASADALLSPDRKSTRLNSSHVKI